MRKNQHISHFRLSAIPFLLSCLILIGCSDTGQDTDEAAARELAQSTDSVTLQTMIDGGQTEAARTILENRDKYRFATMADYLLLTDIYLDRGDVAKAEAALDEAIAMGATPRFVAIQTAKIAMMRSRFDAAESALVLVPLTGEEGFEALVLRAQVAIAQNDFERAQKYYDLAADVLPNDHRIDAAQSFFQLVQGNTDNAIRYAHAALEKNQQDNDPLPYYVLGSIDRLKGNVGAAVVHLEQALAAQPNHILSKLELTGTSIDLGNVDKAQGILDDVLAKDPDNEIARFYIAYMLANEGELQQASDILVRLRAALDRYYPAKRLYGHIMFRLGSFETATEFLEQYIEAVPEDVETRLLLTESYRRTGKPEKAMGLLEASVSGPQAEIVANTQTGSLNLQEGNFAAARDQYLAALEKANALTVTDDVLVASLNAATASAEYALGNGNEAVRLLSEAIRLDPVQISYFSTLANIQMASGNLKGALATLAEMQKHHESSPVLANLEGAIEFRLGNYGRAIAALDRALAENEDYGSALKNRAAAYIEQGELELAKADLLKALPGAEQDGQFLGMLGRVYLAEDDFDSAIRYYAAARDLVPNSAVFAANHALALAGVQRFDAAVLAAQTAVDLLPPEERVMRARLTGLLTEYKAVAKRR